MSILTSIAKQLLILDDKLHAHIAASAAYRAEEHDQKAAKVYAEGIAQVKRNVKAAQAEGAALIAEAEAAVRRAKSRQVEMVAAAEAESAAVDAKYDALKAKASTCDSKGLQHVVCSQKAREAVQAL